MMAKAYTKIKLPLQGGLLHDLASYSPQLRGLGSGGHKALQNLLVRLTLVEQGFGQL